MYYDTEVLATKLIESKVVYIVQCSVVRLSEYHDSTCYRDSLGLFIIVIVDYLTIRIVILHEFA